ncbi:GLUG motif-containing protein [Breznakibacter xylanolyticus]|uniref:GLUG motif-containing protein n=1 Tax=Breznakibacter xylanolyticus TaxID=990 RepID=A0A2W7N931_9BACT|nr:LamG-like jellyroll fold domain-containing protein [Breznakibacter xylanolyticus]PZX16163.1 GLUG motif-containing protein [Breznakibacter xylanolyticus]
MKNKLLLTLILWLTLLGSAWAQGNALHFDGSNDYVDLPDFTTTHDFSQGFTFTAWVKWDAFTGNARVFEIGNGSGNVNNSIILRTDASSGTLIFQCASGTTNSEIKTDAAVVTADTWHHVAATISSTGDATIYIDGAAVKSGSISIPQNVTRANNWLGKSAWSVDNYFKGTMDEVSIWHKALTPTEIETIKQASPTGNEDKIIAYYNFNQTTGTTLTDATTNAKHGTLKDFAVTGATSNWVVGYTPPTPPAANNALHFDGTSDYVQCPAVNPATFTMEAWVYPTQLNRDQAVISTLSVANASGMELHVASDNKPLVTIRNGSNWLDVKATSTVAINTWTHLAATYNGGTVKLYINGAEAATAAATSYAPGTSNLFIGRRPDNEEKRFAGRIDEVRIWNVVRTQTEIAAAKDNPLTGTESSLLAYYNFNQGTATGSNSGITTLTDATTNAKHGTLNGFALTGSTSNWVEGFVAGTTPTYNLSATPTTLTLDAASGSNGSITITSNTAWTISGSADWLELSAISGSGNGSITLTALSENSATTERTASFTLMGTGITEPITIAVAQSPIVSVIITKTDASVITSKGNTLQEAIVTTILNEIKKIEVINGKVIASDWRWFYDNKSSLTDITHLTIGNSVTSVANIPNLADWEGRSYFGSQLEEVIIHKIDGIGNYAFSACSNLTKAYLPDTRYVGDRSFLQCTKLNTNLHIPKLIGIDEAAFALCSSIEEFDLPNLEYINKLSFSSCTNLKKISLPKITSIPYRTFYSCSNLTYMALGANPPKVGSEVFNYAKSPRYLTLADANGNLLTGTELENARTSYKAVDDGNTTDNLWFGCTIDRQPYKLVVNEPENGTLTAGTPDEMVFGGYPAGTTINVTATPSYGYKLANGSPRAYKTGNENIIQGIENNKFEMPNDNITVTATFEPKLSASANTVTLGKEAEQSQSVTITCDGNYEITNIEESPDWLQVGFLTMGETRELIFTTKRANPWGFEREVVFTLTAAEANDITITVKQEAAPEVFTVSKTQATLGYQQGSTDIITITNNIPWSASTAPYSHLFSVSPTEGAGNAELTITALTENTGLTDIYGVISVNGETYPITQRFNAKELSISQTDILVGKEAGSSVQVQVTSGTDWQFDNINGHFYCEPAYGTGNATVTITANNSVLGYRNNVSTPLLTGADAYPVQLRITQKSDYMPLGDGTAANPFQISTLDNLRWMSENLDYESPYLRSHYVLTNDIDAQETHNWPDGFRAISMSNTNYFAGTFNGKGYAISNLLGYGLFYKTAPEARIDSLALVNILVKGAGCAGLVSYNEGTINACYVTGYMTGSGMGMLACKNSGTISNCYTSGFIAGDNLAGLCFGNSGTISGSYTAVGSLYGMYNDGFVWQNDGTAHGYFNKELFTDTNSPAIGLTTAQMQQQANFEGWDFTNVWSMTEGKSFPRLQGVYNYPLLLPTYPIDGIPNVPYYANIEIVEMDYPVASVELTKAPEGMELIDRFIDWTPTTGGQYDVTITITDTNGKAVAYTYTITVELWGEGTEANPYLIHTIAELDMMRQMQPYTHFLLMNDLDFAGTKYAYNPQYPEATGWQPIGNSEDHYFRSHFNGNGHIIKNLYIKQPYGGNLGLFGPCYKATIKNLGLVDVNITGHHQCGGITGLLDNSTITGCYVTGSVKGNSSIGGLVGESKDSQVAKCYANATVKGDMFVGGLIGYNNAASLSNSYAAGTVSGRKHVGGLLGAGEPDFTSCYSVSVATDSAAYRGLFGDVSGSSIINNYYLLEGNADVTNFEGTRLTAQQLMQQASFTDWDFTDTWQITEGQTLPRLRGMYNHPVVLPVADTAQINKPYTHTLRVVGMDNTVASVSISGVEGMTLSETDNTLTWTPDNANEPTLTVTATDANGAVTHHRQRIAVIPFDGEGTIDNPYKITTIAQLNAVRSYSDKCFILMNDLNFDGSEYSKANSQKGWLPIEKFTGMLYGKNHVIKNLYINRIEMESTGLFGIIENAYITELGLAGVHIQGGDKTGAICGESSISTITRSYVSGTIHGSDVNTGGLAGYSQSSTITNCYNTASIYASGGYLGGIAGVNLYGNIGYCYNGGMLFNDEMGFTGAIVGRDDDGIYDSTLFDGDINPGVAACGETSGPHGYLTEFTTEGMKQAANFISWDFNSIWQIREGQTYPAHRSKNNAPFAFAEEIHVGARQSITNLLANDYDYETLQEKLVLRVLSMDGPGEITQNSCFAFPAGTATGTTTKLKYMVGEVTAPGDTLWGGQAVATMIKKENQEPESVYLTVTIDEDSTLEEFDALSTASDPDGDYLTILCLLDYYTLHGTAAIVNNRITYKPNANYHGVDDIAFAITDGDHTSGGFINITISPVNDAPVLTAVANKTIKEGETLTLTMDDVTATDAEGDELSLVIANGENYTVNGTTITPANGFTGVLSVGISVTDGELTSNQMVMTVTVTPATGIDDNITATVSAYPNPFTDYVVIESEEPIHSVSFINILGKTVQHTSMPQAQISTQNLLPGIYLIKVDFAKGKPVVIRMVKQ